MLDIHMPYGIFIFLANIHMPYGIFTLLARHSHALWPQCCGAATFLGGSGSRSPRSRSRLRLRPTWVGSGSRQKKAAPAPYTKFFHFELLKSKFLIQVYLDHIYPSKLPLKSCLTLEQGFSFLQGCGSAFTLCGSGSGSFSECGSGSRSRSSLTKFEGKKS